MSVTYDEFIGWLRANNLKTQLFKNVEDFGHAEGEVEKYISSSLEQMQEEVMSCLFLWSSSHEGRNFWSNVNSLFRDYVKQKRIEEEYTCVLKRLLQEGQEGSFSSLVVGMHPHNGSASSSSNDVIHIGYHSW